MHPVLRQMKPASAAPFAVEPQLSTEEGEGVARLSHEPESHPRVVLKKDTSESFVPKTNLVRDDCGEYPETTRDLRLRAGKELNLNKNTVLTDHDFDPMDGEPTAISRGKAHLRAADLVTSYEQTVKQEKSFQQTFNNHVRTFISRHEVTVGLMHLWDFVEAYISNPQSKTLTAQLFLIVQHSRDDGIFKESLLNIAEAEGRWLYDLINILQTIIVQERTLRLSEKVAAINYSVLTLGKFYARKIYNTPFVPMDKEVKIDTFYMRMVIKILSLSDDLGIYRNEKMQMIVSNSRKKELSDASLMYHLKRAFVESAESQYYPESAAIESEEEIEDEV